MSDDPEARAPGEPSGSAQPIARPRARQLTELLALLLCVGILAGASAFWIYKHRLNGPPIRSDGYGYYAYLPAWFIHHDLSFDTLARREFAGTLPPWTGMWRHPETHRYVDKYPPGTALLETPSFLAGHLAARLVHAERSGYSNPYQYANVASGIGYLLLGAWLTYLHLRRRFGHGWALLTVGMMVFGTNLFHYATYDGSLSHVYSFALISLFVFLVEVDYQSPRMATSAAIGLVLGLIATTRIVNVLVVLLYLFYGVRDLGELKRRFLTAGARRYRLMALAGAFVGLLPLLAYWRFATGSFLVDSYPGEHFNWSQPQVLNFLFSIRKGLLFWSPVLTFAFLGLLLARRRLSTILLSLVIYHPLQLYVASSWYLWDYAGSFGQRPYVDIASVLAISAAAFFARVKDLALGVAQGLTVRWRASALPAMLALASLLVAWNLLAMVGYWYRIIPYTGTTPRHLYRLFRWYLS